MEARHARHVGRARYVGRSRRKARGLHSSTFQLNVRAFCGIGGAFTGWVVQGVIERCWEVLGGVLYQKRFRLSSEVDECQPLSKAQHALKAGWGRHCLSGPTRVVHHIRFHPPLLRQRAHDFPEPQLRRDVQRS